MMSWERELSSCFEDIKTDLIEYINTDDFKIDWRNWLVNDDIAQDRFRKRIKYILGGNGEYSFKTLIKTNTLVTMFTVIEISIFAQFQMMYLMTPVSTPHDKIKNNGIKLMNNAIDLVLTKPLYKELCNEYKQFWNAAEKIQIHWKKCISKPSYIICQNRLKREFEELV